MAKKIITDHVSDEVDRLIRELRKQIYAHPYHGWEEICAQVTVTIPDTGLVGIEVCGGGEDNRYFVVGLYVWENDDWHRAWACPFAETDADAVKSKVIESIKAFVFSRKRDERNRRRQKYRKGELILSLDELVQQEFVYWNNKITHRGWFMSWQLRMTMYALKSGVIYRAIKKEEDNA